MTEQNHIPVLLNESLEALSIKKTGIYLDATFGRGGHSEAILAKLEENGRLFAIDRDPDAILAAKILEARDQRFAIWQGNFSEIARAKRELKIEGGFDGILFDLGVSSCQLDDASRGFSFRFDGPLDMRMNNQAGISAAEWVNSASAEEMADVFWRYGEERRSRIIAKAIVKEREAHPFETTAHFVKVIESVMPPQHILKKHPATRVFQAVRIHVNNELESIKEALSNAKELLNPMGRLVVISFHSLEDRLVKIFFKSLSEVEVMPRGLPPASGNEPGFRMPIKKCLASKGEMKENPRSRSAVMRILEKK